MRERRYLRLYLFLLLGALVVVCVHKPGVASTRSAKLYLWRAKFLNLEKTQVQIIHNNENTTIPVAEQLHVVGPVRPGSDVNVVYAENAKGKLVVLLQFQANGTSETSESAGIQKNDEAVPVPNKLAKRILKIVRALRPAQTEPLPAAPNEAKPAKPSKDLRKVIVANGLVSRITAVSPFERVLSIAPSPSGPTTTFTLDLLTSVFGKLEPSAKVKINYVSLDSKNVASEVQVAQDVAPGLQKPNEVESGKVASTHTKTRRLTGCLQKGEDANEYKLTAKDGGTWEIRSDSVKLDEYVGHTVKVTGVPIRILVAATAMIIAITASIAVGRNR